MVLCGGKGDEEIGGGFVRKREGWWVVHGMWERTGIEF